MLGEIVVDASGSRAQLSVLEPLVTKVVTFTFSFASLGKRKQNDPKSRLELKISLTFRGEKTLDPGTHPDQEDKDYHTG